MTTLSDCLNLTDDALLSAVTANVTSSNRGLAELIVFLGEVERRKLYLERAYASMFAFCTEALGLSEGAAYRRIGAARLARKFPAVLSFVTAGKVHLTALNLLAPELTEDNHLELLEATTGKTKRETQELLVARCPKPEPATSVRRLPARRPATHRPRASAPAGSGALELRAPAPSPTIEPVAAERYAVKFTASSSLVAKLDELEALRSHRPAEARAVETMLEEAVDLLIAKERKVRFAVGRKPRGAAGGKQSRAASQSRHIPAPIRREVYERDGGCCQFLDPDSGRRCGETWQLTFEHRLPVALGGQHSVGGISWLCAAHNRLMADRVLGSEVMAAKVEAARFARPTDARISSVSCDP